MGSCCSYEKKEDYDWNRRIKENKINLSSKSLILYCECYKYKTRIIDTHDNIRYKEYIVTEFFVINKNVCFNKQSVFRSPQPRNTDKICPTVLVKVPINIINQITKIIELQEDGKKNQARDIMLALNFSKQFHDLFIN
jgi:hypothetical protein